jgi:hypothetical protein
MAFNFNCSDGNVQASLKKPRCDYSGRPEAGGFREKEKSSRGGEPGMRIDLEEERVKVPKAGANIVIIDPQIRILALGTVIVESLTFDPIVVGGWNRGEDMLLVLCVVIVSFIMDHIMMWVTG